MRTPLRPAILALGALLSHGGWAAPGLPPETLTGRSVVAYFHHRDRDAADTAVEAADELAPRLQHDLAANLGGRARIVVCSTDTEFEQQAGRSLATWILGLADPEENRVLVRALPATTLRQVTRHELAHLFMGKALGDYEPRAPRWLHEGAAKYYSDDWSGTERALLDDAVREGKLYHIADLATFPTHPDRAAIAYAESYVLVRYLISLDPGRGLAPFIENLKATGDVSRAFRRAYGLSVEQVEAGMREQVLRETQRAVPAWAVETAIFFAMAVLFVIAYLRVRRRSREIRERMEEEELLERLFDESRRRRRLFGPPPPPP
jgi:Peptidase MA superfamily